MGNNVFFMFCDNHLYLLVLQHVKDQNKVQKMLLIDFSIS